MEAVIMTGGRGIRLRPYTDILPKGLLPVGESPILELIVHKLKAAGVTGITMACGYKAPLIQTYFGDGSAWDVVIRHVVEKEPLGTAGALKMCTHIHEPFLVINCDVLTTLNIWEFASFHRSHGDMLTVASQKRTVPIEFGVLETHQDVITGIKEKPFHEAMVSMGIYMANPDIREYIPADCYVDMPDLIMLLLSSGEKVRHYTNNAFWLDIGRPEDYMRAKQVYTELAGTLFNGEYNG
ncbi:NTP transferase domain-containing protein [Aneurinibacillus sp. BA2021]|nr:NTP transferase domain-containing protein [Aneurinibacillus sp. BA2021]